jgi:hypothetical protein
MPHRDAALKKALYGVKAFKDPVRRKRFWKMKK